MRCKKCGGMLHHLATDVTGRNFYQCHTGLTAFRHDGTRLSHIVPCDTVYDQNGNEFHGLIAITDEGRGRTFAVA